MAAPLHPRTTRRLTWLVPLLVAAAVVAGALVESAGASAAPRLAPRTPAQLLAAIARTSTTALSGRISETSQLGLPDLPGASDQASLSWQTFLTGTHSVRVWVDGADRQRIAVIGELSEADVVHDGQDVWTYTSQSNTVSHTVLRGGSRHRDVEHGNGPPLTPEAAAARVLALVSPSTSVTLGGNVMVAGRSAYTLVIAPRDSRSTIRRITIAVDSAHLVPLRVDVYGASSAPAIRIGFTEVSFARPAASIFAFHAPKGATVTTDPFGGRHFGVQVHRATYGGSRGPVHARAYVGMHHAGPFAQSPRPRVIGSGWTAVLEVHGMGDGLLGGTFAELTSPVGTSGMRLLHTALINAVLMPDGRVFVGAMTPTALEHVATTTSG